MTLTERIARLDPVRKASMALVHRAGVLTACDRHVGSGEPLLNFIRRVRAETDMQIGDLEALQLELLARSARRVPGHFAEVGVYKGGSAKVLASAKMGKWLHLFETFEGIPDNLDIDLDKRFHVGMFPASVEDVKNALSQYGRITIHAGTFPDSAEVMKNEKFALAHLDADTYQTTLDGLKFFFPRMSRGGFIIAHDYGVAAGVSRAFDSFFKKRKSPVFELADSQVVVVKL